jgi:hypothetical protein
MPSKTEAFPNFEVLIYFGMSQGQNFMVEVTDDSQHSLASKPPTAIHGCGHK